METVPTSTMELEVENASFMLDTLGKDCEPLQFLRELTENAIQATQAIPGRRGKVIWDIDWATYDADGLVKLCCIDTGVGMSAAELKRYINHLSASRHVQSLRGNFGIGAKVAAAPGNPHGIVYVSWKEGHGSMIQLWRDPSSDKWGLKQFQLADGSYDHCMPLDDSVKPEALQSLDHGTMVLLLGKDREDNTMEPPVGVDNRAKWIIRYLNQRYFRFPQGVEVRVREGWEEPRENTKRNFLRRAKGQGHFLKHASTASGAVPLTDATAHWWILDERHDERARDSLWASTGHRAALYQDELYELCSPARGGYQKVQEFGIRFAYSRVVIYVEPEPVSGLAASTSRSELKIGGQPLPWARWGEEFASNLPQEISDLEEEIAAGSAVEDHQETIRQRLRPLRYLFELSRYRPSARGRLRIAEADNGGRPRAAKIKKKSDAPTGEDGGANGNIYALFEDPKGQRGRKVEPELWPRIDWVSENHNPPSRTPPHLEDRAARYDPTGNRLEINEDFRVFRDCMRRWKDRYEKTPGSTPVVEAEVREWYAQVLVETILGADALRRSRHWDDADLSTVLSPEALTAVVQPRYFIEERLKRDLARRLGQAPSQVAA